LWCPDQVSQLVAGFLTAHGAPAGKVASRGGAEVAVPSPSTNELAAFHRINPATAAKGVNQLVDSERDYPVRWGATAPARRP
jgi:hypothetical protein